MEELAASANPARAAKEAVAEEEQEQFPVGFIEVSDQPTRFVPITSRKKLAGAIAMGIGLGIWLGWRRRR